MNNVYFTIRERLGTKRVGLNLLGFLMTAALLTYLGPFGTWADLAFADRLVFWTTTVGVNWFVALVVFNVTIEAFESRNRPAWAACLLSSLIAALPGSATVWLAAAVYLDYRPTNMSETVGLYAQVLVLHLLIGSLASYAIRRSIRKSDGESGPRSAGETTDPEASRAPLEAALLARLSAGTRADILHLRMQDHYVEVHTAAGMEMLLLRFRDAIQEVEGVDGMRVHRSHWVARAAVARVERRRGGGVVLHLVNGSEVPVSRSFAPTLRKKGWF